jgi:hypothetical protein
MTCSSSCDHTIFFRELIHAASEDTADHALISLEAAFYDISLFQSTNSQRRNDWIAWLQSYIDRIQVSQPCSVQLSPIPHS